MCFSERTLFVYGVVYLAVYLIVYFKQFKMCFSLTCTWNFFVAIIQPDVLTEEIKKSDFQDAVKFQINDTNTSVTYGYAGLLVLHLLPLLKPCLIIEM